MWFRGPKVGSENPQVLQVPRFWIPSPSIPATASITRHWRPKPKLGLHPRTAESESAFLQDPRPFSLFKRHWPECEPSFTWESSKELFKYTPGPPQLGFWINWSEGDPGVGVYKISSGSSNAYPHWEPLSSVTKKRLSGENELVKVTRHQD